MDKLVVLDLTDQAIDVYNIDENFDNIEELVTFLGHDIDYCQWMIVAGDLKITHHKGKYIKDESDNFDNINI